MTCHPSGCAVDFVVGCNIFTFCIDIFKTDDAEADVLFTNVLCFKGCIKLKSNMVCIGCEDTKTAHIVCFCMCCSCAVVDLCFNGDIIVCGDDSACHRCNCHTFKVADCAFGEDNVLCLIFTCFTVPDVCHDFVVVEGFCVGCCKAQSADKDVVLDNSAT